MPRAGKVIRGEHLLLEHAKHNLDLIQPRGMDRQPMNADVEAQSERADPRRQLLGCVGRPVIKDQMQHPDPVAPETGKQHPQELLKFAETLALKTPRQCFAPVHQEAREGPPKVRPPPRAWMAAPNLPGGPGPGGLCPATGLPSLDRRFLIRADDN